MATQSLGKKKASVTKKAVAKKLVAKKAQVRSVATSAKKVEKKSTVKNAPAVAPKAKTAVKSASKKAPAKAAPKADKAQAVAKKPASKAATVTKAKPAPVQKAPEKATVEPPKKAPVVAKPAPTKSSHAGKAFTINRPAPRIVKVPRSEPVVMMDPAEAQAFAMSFAEARIRDAQQRDKKEDVESIRLSRRPTTRLQGQQTAEFPANDLKEFKRRLLDEREHLLTGANAMKETGFNEADDREADGGDGTNSTLRLQALGQVGSMNRTLQQIEQALHRIEEGTYGVCTVCGKLIRKQRLLNQPFVLTCMECQNDIERNNR